jgi:hypothetical protein
MRALAPEHNSTYAPIRRAALGLAPALAALALTACEYPLDACARNHTCQSGGTTDGGMATCMTSTAPTCVDATSHQDLTWIANNIFANQCTFSGCHNGSSTPAGKVDLRPSMAFNHLVNFTSILQPSRKLVVAGDPKSSYLEVMLGIIPPADATPPASPPRADVGYMPQESGGILLCCQKLMAIDQWIAAGAMNN